MNLGFWLAGFLPLLFSAGLAQAFLLLWFRRNEIGSGFSWSLFAVILVVAAGYAGYRQRGRRYSPRDALVYLESRLGLNNALTAADNGVAPWPDPANLPPRTLPAWSWRRIAPWPAWTLAVLVLAASLPVNPAPSTPPPPPVEPIAWGEIESWFQTVEDAEIVENAALDAFREQVDALRRQPPGERYSHSSLEATDALRQRSERALRELRENLEKTARALAAADAFPDGIPSGWEAALREDLTGAITGFEEGLLRIDADLLDQIRELDIQNLSAMPEDDLKNLRECLDAGLAACDAALGDRDSEDNRLLAAFPGPGIGKGPAPAPLSFRDDRALDAVSRRESVPNDDLSRAALGDRVGVGIGDEPDTDRPAYTGPVEPGNMAHPGGGGEAVSRESFTPDEQAVLERYFR